MSELIITKAHLRSVPGLRDRRGYCLRLTRVWFDRHGLDFRAFLREGIPALILEETGDAFALRLVRHARELEVKRGR